MPMIPFSGGSSLEANFSAPHGGMSVDFAFMDRIIALHEDDMDVVVQPSVQWMELNNNIKHTGLFFPVDPGPSAKIGGMVGTNCSGTNAVRYGTMKDWVVNLTVVLADGKVIKTKRRPRKSSAGYNLTSLFVGSEGTLGLVTEITLKLAVLVGVLGAFFFPSRSPSMSTLRLSWEHLAPTLTRLGNTDSQIINSLRKPLLPWSLSQLSGKQLLPHPRLCEQAFLSALWRSWTRYK